MLADRHPRPYSLAGGMCFTLAGLLVLAFAPGFVWILIAVGLIGCGSSVFHPESSRVAQLASGGRKGLAQSIFQVGGNAGSAMGPLLAALIVIPFGQSSIGWFALTALLAIFYPRKDRRLVQTPAGDRGSQARRCGNGFRAQPAAAENPHGPRHSGHSGLSKYFYIASMTSLLYVFPVWTSSPYRCKVRN
ncbi:major facilitator superfamily MFS_1, partial [human gut metagenome]